MRQMMKWITKFELWLRRRQLAKAREQATYGRHYQNRIEGAIRAGWLRDEVALLEQLLRYDEAVR